MREILFRAWDKESETMIYPDRKENLKTAEYTLNAWCDCENDRTILMQFTGLTDKNGVKIFEGDNVRYSGVIGEVFYDNDTAMFMVKFKVSRVNLSFRSMDDGIEVIGNIHYKKQEE